MRKLSAILFGLAFLALPACGSGGTGPGGGNGGDDGNGSVAAEITMGDLSFVDPQGRRNTEASVTIQVGETVRWSNTSSTDHTVTSGEGQDGNAGDGLPQGASSGLASGVMSPGSTYTFTFQTPGTWTYYCEVHPGTMYQATVVVEE